MSNDIYALNESSKLTLLATPLLLLIVLAMLMLPVPTFCLDFLFSFNITFSLILLIMTLYVQRPLDFSVFPTLLLLATLLRLALNIASTRVVLLNGYEGGDAAGKVIEAFGTVVVAGNYFVGLLVFIILMIVNFVVITKGGSRISEVTARFMLDALPGKQMAIDADLNSGVIDHNEAKAKREDITREADFYGAMDGASKFVRGDAIAGLMILLINILGGITIGTLQYDMSLSEAGRVYGQLTIGDGLVAQIPSLLLSTAAAIMVTRISGSMDMHNQVRHEVSAHPKAVLVAAVVLTAIGMVPGMPHVAFIVPGLVLMIFAWRRMNHVRHQHSELPGTEEVDLSSETKKIQWQDISPVDPIGLDIGYRVISLLGSSERMVKDGLASGVVGDAALASQIRHLRHELSRRYGFLLPTVHIRDNLTLDPQKYVIRLHDTEVEDFLVEIGQLLAISTELTRPLDEGQPTREPSYGLSAYWIAPASRELAIQSGYTVVDCATVVTTHLGKVIESHLHDLLGFEETQGWLNNLRQRVPRLCDELVPDKLSIGRLMQVLKRLLQDQISINDSPRIAETLLQQPEGDVLMYVQQIRTTLARQIVDPLVNHNVKPRRLSVFTLSPELEKMLLMAKEQAARDARFSEADFAIDPSLSLQLQEQIPTLISQARKGSVEPVLLVAAPLWPLLSRYARVAANLLLKVLTFQEIPEDLQVDIIGQLG